MLQRCVLPAPKLKNNVACPPFAIVWFDSPETHLFPTGRSRSFHWRHARCKRQVRLTEYCYCLSQPLNSLPDIMCTLINNSSALASAESAPQVGWFFCKNRRTTLRDKGITHIVNLTGNETMVESTPNSRHLVGGSLCMSFYWTRLCIPSVLGKRLSFLEEHAGLCVTCMFISQYIMYGMFSSHTSRAALSLINFEQFCHCHVCLCVRVCLSQTYIYRHTDIHFHTKVCVRLCLCMCL